MEISPIQTITHVNTEGSVTKLSSGDSKSRGLSKTGRNVKAFIEEQADLGRIRKGKGMEAGKPAMRLFSQSS